MYIHDERTGYIHAAGFVPRDAEERTTKNGKSLVSFSIAIHRTQGNETLWRECVVWAGSNSYELAKMIQKSDLVSVDGRIVKNKYMGKDGEERTNANIWVEFLQIQENPLEKLNKFPEKNVEYPNANRDEEQTGFQQVEEKLPF